MLALSAHCKYYLYNHCVDMRKGCYRLCAIVSNEMKKSILSGDIFIFLNKNKNIIKLLQWDKDGFSIYEKRLEAGTFERVSICQNDTDILLSNIEVQHILQGIILQSVRHKKRFTLSREKPVNAEL